MADNKKIRILLIEDEDYDVRRVKNTIKPFEDRIFLKNIVADGKTALELLRADRKNYEIIIMDFHISGGIMGEALIQKIKEIDSSFQIIVITKMTINITDYEFANRLIRAGAYWYCTKYPVDIEDFVYQPTDFIISIFNANEKCLLERERLKSNQKLIKNVEDILFQRKIVGESESIRKLREEIKKFARSNVNTLIRGASGTGKELVAYNIHYMSERKFENFVIINCGSLPEDLVESELFGYEKGAFTGADRRKLGLFEIANNGTVFLDEITELPLPAQVKLLRVIQDGGIEKIGRTEKLKVDVRIIAATNRNIEEEVKAKRFREDLYYRLNVLPIFVPDLKQRRDDIPLLVDYFMTNISIDMVRNKPVIQDEAMNILLDYDWNGNIRELKNVIQRLLFYDEQIITPSIIKIALGINWQEADTDKIKEFFKESKATSLREMEFYVRQKYFEYIRKNSESDSEAAKKLGLAPSNYHRMSKELGLK